MLKTFNYGIGMVLVVEAGQAEALRALLSDAGETVCVLGSVTNEPGIRYINMAE